MANYNDLDRLIYLISKNHIENYHLYHTNILEVNSCNGKYVSWLNELLYTNNYYCTNKSDIVVKRNNDRIGETKNIKFINGDINKSPLPIESCGIIIANFKTNKPYHNITRKVLKHIYKSLHRNGLCIIIIRTKPENPYYNELYSRIINDKEKERPLLKDEHLFRNAGYNKINIFYKNMSTTGYILMK